MLKLHLMIVMLVCYLSAIVTSACDEVAVSHALRDKYIVSPALTREEIISLSRKLDAEKSWSKDWKLIKHGLKLGDCLHHVISPEADWRSLSGFEGYIYVKDGKLIALVNIREQ